jgi:proline iminopeptidase
LGVYFELLEAEKDASVPGISLVDLEHDALLLDDVGRIRRIPGVIVQGRYNVVCPMRSAWHLHKAWPQADLQIVCDAGHASFEDGIAREFVGATDAFAAR